MTTSTTNVVSPPPYLDAAYAFCKAYTKERAKNFYFAFSILPKEKRRAIYATYAFAGHVDDIGDDPLPLSDKQRRLADFRARLDGCYEGRREDPLFLALGDAIDRFAIPKEYFDELANGIEMDFAINRYKTFDDLKQYCYRVASMIGLLCIQIFGYRPHPEAKDWACDLGVALQLGNIMRDVKEDAIRDRIYLPLEDLQRFGYSEEELMASKLTPAFREMMTFEAQRAREFFASGRKLLPLLDLRSRMCVNVLQGIYTEIVDRIEQRGFDVYSERVSLSTPEKLKSIARLWYEAARIKQVPA